MLPFCEKCHDIVAFNVIEEQKVKIIKGREISFLGKETNCSECGSLLFVPEIHDDNLKIMNEEYAIAEGLITIPEILKVLDMYNIGKRPLSLVLGWGEGTLTRYLNGDMPTKQYSQTIKKVINDPSFMKELLEKNKDKIAESAYSSCKESIEKIFEGTSPINDIVITEIKIENVVQYLLYKCVDITPLALQKLLYYAQSFHKAFYNEFLFEDDCEAWVHGPVYRGIYEEYKMYGFNPIDEHKQFIYNKLTDVERELLDAVIKNFGCYSGKVLEEMTHVESPWKESRVGLGKEESSNRVISKESMEDYFKSIKSKYDMLNTSDIRDYSADLFNKIFH